MDLVYEVEMEVRCVIAILVWAATHNIISDKYKQLNVKGMQSLEPLATMYLATQPNTTKVSSL